MHGPRLRGIVARIVPTDGSSWLSTAPESIGSAVAAIASEGCGLWMADLDQWKGHDHDPQACLDSLDWERAVRKPEGQSRERFITSRVLLRQILGALLNERPADLRFDIDAHGKPTLTQPHGHCHFNLSHSGALLLIGTRVGASIGVDIEVPRSVPRALQLAERVFTSEERSRVMQASTVSAAARDDEFMRIWTRKEAYLKCRGDGFTKPAREYAVASAGSSMLDGVEICSLSLPLSGYAAVASIAPLSHIRRFQLCRADTL